MHPQQKRKMIAVIERMATRRIQLSRKLNAPAIVLTEAIDIGDLVDNLDSNDRNLHLQLDQIATRMEELTDRLIGLLRHKRLSNLLTRALAVCDELKWPESVRCELMHVAESIERFKSTSQQTIQRLNEFRDIAKRIEQIISRETNTHG